MKELKAPEKIYLHPDIGGREFLRPWLKRRANQESVEYIRADAFIEKAEKWFEEHFMNRLEWEIATYEFENIQSMIDDFKNYMKGE